MINFDDFWALVSTRHLPLMVVALLPKNEFVRLIEARSLYASLQADIALQGIVQRKDVPMMTELLEWA